MNHRLLFLAGLIALMATFIVLPIGIGFGDDEKPGERRDRGGEAGKADGKKKGEGKRRGPKIEKPRIADTVRANVYADNWFKLFINGNLMVVDSISFIPHNVVSVDTLPVCPTTIAVMARSALQLRCWPYRVRFVSGGRRSRVVSGGDFRSIDC